MKKILFGLFTIFFLLATTTLPLYAAMVKAGESIYLPETEENLQDLYLFGSAVAVDASVTNDLIAAGNDVTINGDVSGNVMAAGGDVTVRSAVQGSTRVAGGNVVVSGSTGRDLLVAGGKVLITQEASVSGDLLAAVGDIVIESPVEGDVHINGGTITINAPINGNVSGNMGELTLGKNARIAGDLRYTSTEKATIQSGAVVEGKQYYSEPERKTREPQGMASNFTGWALYKLAIDIIICILLVTFVPLLVTSTLERAINKPFASAGFGFLLFIFIPLFSLFLLFLLWLGFASFLFYGILAILSIFFTKLLIGWWILRWWMGRNKKEYILDWKAAVAGPLAGFLLLLIPVLGWLVLAVIYFMMFGALTRSIVALATNTKS